MVHASACTPAANLANELGGASAAQQRSRRRGAQRHPSDNPGNRPRPRQEARLNTDDSRIETFGF